MSEFIDTEIVIHDLKLRCMRMWPKDVKACRTIPGWNEENHDFYFVKLEVFKNGFHEKLFYEEGCPENILPIFNNLRGAIWEYQVTGSVMFEIYRRDE